VNNYTGYYRFGNNFLILALSNYQTNMKTIYALLVGIDNYPPPVPKLGGAVKDK